jgi:hypothetical protein
MDKSGNLYVIYVKSDQYMLSTRDASSGQWIYDQSIASLDLDVYSGNLSKLKIDKNDHFHIFGWFKTSGYGLYVSKDHGLTWKLRSVIPCNLSESSAGPPRFSMNSKGEMVIAWSETLWDAQHNSSSYTGPYFKRMVGGRKTWSDVVELSFSSIKFAADMFLDKEGFLYWASTQSSMRSSRIYSN